MEHPKQNHGIHSTGNRDQQGLTPTQKPMVPDGLFNVIEQGAHDAMLFQPHGEARRNRQNGPSSPELL